MININLLLIFSGTLDGIGGEREVQSVWNLVTADRAAGLVSYYFGPFLFLTILFLTIVIFDHCYF